MSSHFYCYFYDAARQAAEARIGDAETPGPLRDIVQRTAASCPSRLRQHPPADRRDRGFFLPLLVPAIISQAPGGSDRCDVSISFERFLRDHRDDVTVSRILMRSAMG